MPEDVHFGNAARDGAQYRGWLVGHFINSDHANIRRSDDVEVKWFFHPAGQERDRWVTDETATTLCMLIRGRFRVQLSTGTYTLKNEGDYFMWGPGVDHLWHAEEDSLVLTIRWPSRQARKPRATGAPRRTPQQVLRSGLTSNRDPRTSGRPDGPDHQR